MSTETQEATPNRKLYHREYYYKNKDMWHDKYLKRKEEGKIIPPDKIFYCDSCDMNVKNIWNHNKSQSHLRIQKALQKLPH